MAWGSGGVLQWRAMAVPPPVAPAERRGGFVRVSRGTGRPFSARVAAIVFGLALPLLLTELGLRLIAPGVGAPRLPLRYDVES